MLGKVWILTTKNLLQPLIGHQIAGRKGGRKLYHCFATREMVELLSVQHFTEAEVLVFHDTEVVKLS